MLRVTEGYFMGSLPCWYGQAWDEVSECWVDISTGETRTEAICSLLRQVT